MHHNLIKRIFMTSLIMIALQDLALSDISLTFRNRSNEHGTTRYVRLDNYTGIDYLQIQLSSGDRNKFHGYTTYSSRASIRNLFANWKRYESGKYNTYITDDCEMRLAYQINGGDTQYTEYFTLNKDNNFEMTEVRFTPRDIMFETGILNTAYTNSRDQLHTVNFSNEFPVQPILVFGSVSKNGNEPMSIHIDYVEQDQFHYTIGEWWDYDGTHLQEEVSWFAILPGVFFDSDMDIEVQGQTFYYETGVQRENVDADYAYTPVVFSHIFDEKPVVMHQVSTNNQRAWPEAVPPVNTRITDVQISGLEARYYGPVEAYSFPTVSTTYCYLIAFEQDKDTVLNGTRFKSSPLDNKTIRYRTNTTTARFNVIDRSSFTNPVTLVGLQSIRNFFMGSATLRSDNVSGSYNHMNLVLQAEEVYDDVEEIGWVIIGQ